MFYKKYDVNFNHYIFAVISKALKPYISTDHIVASFPVSIRYPKPQTQLKNMLNAAVFELPIEDDLTKVQNVKTQINWTFNPESMWAANIANWMLSYLPFFLSRFVYNRLFMRWPIDIIMSNVACPR